MQKPESQALSNGILKVWRIECEEIVLRKGSGPPIALIAGEDCSGIWIGQTSPENALVAIYVGALGQNGIGIYGAGPRHAMTVALGTSKDGDGMVQLVSPNGDVVILGKEHFAKLEN